MTSLKLSKRKMEEAAAYISQGNSLIKQGLDERWQNYVFVQMKYPYSRKGIEASLRIMGSLSAGKTPEEALFSTRDIDISTFLGGHVALAVSLLHPRGEEFKKYYERFLN